ncbi:MAG TPA: YetF domain-containing protein [Acidimicrobiales bacterium]|nr:YetF domain-containing protein [Acidimicrobiales bacterium]
MGAIIGRTAVAGSQSYATGAVALVTLIAVHRAASLLRFNPLLGKLADHRVRVLVEHGRLRTRELRRCGLTDNDLFSHLRQRGVFSLDGIRYVLYEAKGSITVVPEDDRPDAERPDAPLVEAGIDGAAGYP